MLGSNAWNTRELVEKRSRDGSFFLFAFSTIRNCGKIIGIGKPSFRTQSMRRFGLYAALAMYVYGLPATAEERFERWSLDQPGDFIFALSFKRSISFDDRTATSELAFLCNQEEKYVAVLLIPLDGTFKNRQNSIPVMIQKIEEQSDASDLMQRWEKGPGYVFLESPDKQEELASYLKDREAEGLKSVHFYFPNDLDASTRTTNHMVIDLTGVAAFANRCEPAQ
jgi:hypothetical protein